jgi:hypothetical protein
VKKGDLVVALEDKRRGIHCIGMVLDTRYLYADNASLSDAFVLWYSPSHPMGWWFQRQLKVISESR